MKIDLNSPVEVWRIDAPNTGFPSCELTLFNLSGHGLIDMAAYDKFLAGDLVNYSLSDEEINQNIKELDDMFK